MRRRDKKGKCDPFGVELLRKSGVPFAYRVAYKTGQSVAESSSHEIQEA